MGALFAVVVQCLNNASLSVNSEPWWFRTSRATAHCQPNSSVFFGLRKGCLQDPVRVTTTVTESSDDAVGFTRLAVVLPWTQDACGSGCSQLQRLPATFEAWLASAVANADVADFIIVHETSAAPLFAGVLASITAAAKDTGATGSTTSNVRLVAVPSLESQYAQLNVSGLRISSQKIKDLKPMIGYVFRELLVGYLPGKLEFNKGRPFDCSAGSRAALRPSDKDL